VNLCDSDASGNQQKILVTGGCGYIGCHTVLELLQKNYKVVVVDNLCNSVVESLKRVEIITGKPVQFYEVDLLDKEKFEQVFMRHKFDSCIHFAGLKAVGESVALPINYYNNNITGTINLINLMDKYDCKSLVFSSSATVYGIPQYLPIDEDHPLSCTNPYGRTKLFIEEILRDLYVSDCSWNITILRYFNPTGAHPSGMIGEDPNGPPNNLMPYISQTAIGKREFLGVFGNNYDTVDGTGVRDYIHVVDLALGHVASLEKMNYSDKATCEVYNLGTGNGYSVLEMVKAFENVSNTKIPYKYQDRRVGDVGECFANPSKSKMLLKWSARFGLNEMCEDLWRWQDNNKNGYST